MLVQFKKLVPHAVEPTYAHGTDACVDLYAVDSYKNYDYNYVEYGTGLAIKVPSGHVGLLFPRSSISKTPHLFCNAVGVIDSGYTGEVLVRMKYKKGKEDLEYAYGDKIAQLLIVPYPKVEFEEVDELPQTDRGVKGFGSSGR